MKKVLFVATLRCHIAQFHQPYLKFFQENGFEVHIATRDNSADRHIALSNYDHFHEIQFERIPWRKNNIRAYMDLAKLLRHENYDVIHCHTPMGAFLTRILAKKYRKNGLRVLYTAHGFHFYKGAPLKNWLLYYPVEKWLSRYTDCLITINEEDFQQAKSHNFKMKHLELVNGVGVDLKEFVPQTAAHKSTYRQQYGYSDDSFIILCAANLSYRKNQDLLIRAASLIKDDIPGLRIILAGTGEREDLFREMIRNRGLEDIIQLIGYVRKIPEYLTMSDLLVSTARQEGLPINIIEAMATGIPIIATDCRGNRDLLSDGKNAYLVDIEDESQLAERIMALYHSSVLCSKFSENSLASVETYSTKTILNQMSKIYREYMNVTD